MAKKYLLYIHHPNFTLEKKKSELVNRLLDNHYDGEQDTQNTKLSTNNVYTHPSSPSARTTKDVLADIQQAKLELDELLEVNQDPNDHRQQQEKIQGLWNEYYILKEQDEV